MAAEPNSVTFQTTVAVTGNNTGIVIPEEAIEQLAAGKRPPVLVNVNGYQYRTTVGVMGGQHMISISAAVRMATGLKGGDPIRVSVTVTDTPRQATLPADFAATLATDQQASAFFGQLSNSVQRYHADSITAAKGADARQRRIDKAIALFRAASKDDRHLLMQMRAFSRLTRPAVARKGRPLPRRLASSVAGGSLALPGSRDQAGIEVWVKLSVILAPWLFKRCESHK